MTSRLLAVRPGRKAASLLATAAVFAAAAACASSTKSATGPAASPTVSTLAPTSGSMSQGADSSLHMITNHGHRLAFHVVPGHLPAIVLDSGGGQDSSYWKNLVPVLSKDTGSEIITYDRAGMGDSDEVPGPWKVEDAVSDLDAGLQQLGVTHDVVLVPHSEAGEIATYFVNDHPGVVAGAVLVDASLPDFYTPSELARVIAANQDQIAQLAKAPSTKQTRQLLAVAQNYGPAHQAYHQMTWPQDVPAIVVASAKTPFDTSPADAQLWRDAQAAFAAHAPNRQLVTAAGSSHDVPLDRPDVVIKAVQDMIAEVNRTH
ncbi:pimeloyl-ACP methyl ester carboxylesterase [Catenulispora sp. MAP5-51]|uniref:alpha/beta fold hydrolase n=1 Tax=Catenulispora sp. MAP5-51 TaxID=3156298 RepID=UPI003510D853